MSKSFTLELVASDSTRRVRRSRNPNTLTTIESDGQRWPRSVNALDLGAEAGQVLHEQGISAVDVEHVVDFGVSVRDQAG